MCEQDKPEAMREAKPLPDGGGAAKTDLPNAGERASVTRWVGALIGEAAPIARKRSHRMPRRLVFALAPVLAMMVGAAMTPPRVLRAEEPPPAQQPAGNGTAAQAPGRYPFRQTLPGIARAATPPPPAPPPPPPPPPPAPPPPSPELVALEGRLAALIDGTAVPGLFAVAVTDLQTGHTIGAGLDRLHLSGCIANLFVIVASLRDVQAGRYALADVDATIRQTIWASDALAALDLYEAVGGGDVVAGVRVVEALMHDTFGMPAAVLDHPPADAEHSIGTDPNNYLTAREVNGALARLYAGSLLDAELTSYLLEAMTRVKPGLNYLTAVVPAPAVVSHKNGFFPASNGWVDNDTSIVRFGPNLEHAYALTFFSEAVPTLYGDIPLGQRLVRETWEHFRTAYP